MQQARDLVLQASLQEFLDRLPSGQPLVCAECPGWVCYAEKKVDPVVLPMLSTVKSPLLVQDHLVKAADPTCTHICYDKKLESHRVAAGPVVLTTKKLEDWVRLEDWATPCPEVPDLLQRRAMGAYRRMDMRKSYSPKLLIASSGEH